MRSRKNDDRERHLPLTPATFRILLALANGPAHGYAIMQEVKLQTDDQVRIGPGTLYGSLKRLVETGLVMECDGADDADERRRYYRLTGLGREVARAEARRLEAMVSEARAKRLIGPARS